MRAALSLSINLHIPTGKIAEQPRQILVVDLSVTVEITGEPDRRCFRCSIRRKRQHRNLRGNGISCPVGDHAVYFTAMKITAHHSAECVAGAGRDAEICLTHASVIPLINHARTFCGGGNNHFLKPVSGNALRLPGDNGAGNFR